MFVGGQLLVVSDLGWNDRQWHHVVATFGNVNSGKQDGFAALYIDGVRRATMEGYRHSLTWNIDGMTIGLGQRFAGNIDEFLILDVCLDEESIAELVQCKGPVLS